MRHGVGILILEPAGRLMLQQRDDKPGVDNAGKIATWGGACEGNETPIEAAVRELHEELGLAVSHEDLLPWRTFDKIQTKHGKEEVVHLFVLKQRVSPRAVTVYEGQGYQLVGIGDELAALPFSPLAREFVIDFLNERRRSIRTIVFDIGGVVVDYNGRQDCRAIQAALHLDDVSFSALWTELVDQLGLGRMDEAAFWRYAVSKYGVTVSDLETDLLAQSFNRVCQPRPAIMALLSRLKAAGVPLAVLSNTIEPHARVLSAQGVYASFDQLFLSHETGLRKPDPEAYRQVLHTLQLPAPAVLFIDDNAQNVAAAEALGMRGVVADTANAVVRAVRQTVGPPLANFE